MRVAPRGNPPRVRALARAGHGQGAAGTRVAGTRAHHRARRRGPRVHRHQDHRGIHRAVLRAVLGRITRRDRVGKDVRRRRRQPLRRLPCRHRVLRVYQRHVAAGAAVAPAGGRRPAWVPQGAVGVRRIRLLFPRVWTVHADQELYAGDIAPEQRPRYPRTPPGTRRGDDD